MVDFIDQIRALAALIPQRLDGVKTEGATKTAFVLPFIQALGYNVFDPTEVVPEFTADVGIKKGEKVDYALMKDGQPIVLFECKHHVANLDQEHASQLHRYFHVTAARIGVLTNGVIYRFFSDLEEPNKMDSKPFLELDMLDIKEPIVEEVKKLSRGVFVVDQVINAASEFKHTREIQRILASEFVNPSDDFVRFFAEKVYPGKKITQAVRQNYAEFTRRACQQFISDLINDRLKTAMSPAVTEARASDSKPISESIQMAAEPGVDSKDGKVVTTEEEIEGFHIVKAIVRETVDPKRVVMRDTVNYCGVLLDDNNRKPICRLHFNGEAKFIMVMGAKKTQERIVIENLNDLFKHAAKLKSAAASFDLMPVGAVDAD